MGTAAVVDLFHTQGPDKFHQLIVNMRRANPKSRIASEVGINALGYNLLGHHQHTGAIAVLRMNTEDFPQSPNTYDSLAEALAKSGDVAQATAMYARALEVDPNYVNADYAKKFIAEHK
jgi:predicted Zn-dependent protease